MRQITKFYIASFLKNQAYFAPVFIVLLQFYHLDMKSIFLLFTIGSIVSMIIEIPTGLFADLFGKKRSVILSRIIILLSFILYGFARDFWVFAIAQVIFEIGNAFRSGTETAYIFDYINQKKTKEGYTEVKGKQKFWARVGESIASVIGGFIAKYLGFNWVFFIASVPALLNLLSAISWESITESTNKTNLKNTISHMKHSICQLCKKKGLAKVLVNIMIFTSVLAALAKFIQPYMKEANVPIEWFGVVYAVSLALSAVAVRYSYLIEKWLGKIKMFNLLTIVAAIPAFILGFRYISLIGVGLFFLIVIIENIRSPIANNLFHSLVESKERATLGSIMSLAKSFGKALLLPVIGFFTDTYSMYLSLIVLGFILVFNGVILSIKKGNHAVHNKA